jgi:AhpD family alkylhydroperoxidase
MSGSQPRVSMEDFANRAPAAPAALRRLGEAIDASGLDKTLTELVKLRASQINGCAYCVQFHINLLRKLDVAPEKIDLIAVWREAGIFSERETAALAWTEALTESPNHNATDEAYAALLTQFTEQEAIFLTAAIGLINAWNRIGVGLRFAPPIPGR